MKKLGEPFEFVGETVFGKTHIQTRQYFEIEATDKKIPHWLGHDRPAKIVHIPDIGKRICRHSDPTGWVCFSFASGESVDNSNPTT